MMCVSGIMAKPILMQACCTHALQVRWGVGKAILFHVIDIEITVMYTDQCLLQGMSSESHVQRRGFPIL